MAIQAVLFDLGETLFNYGDVNVDRIFAAAARATYDYLGALTSPDRPLPGFWYYHHRHNFSIKGHYFWSLVFNREFDCLHLLDQRARAMGLHLTAEQLTELAVLWYRPLGNVATIEPDLHQTLEKLQQMSLQLAIVSNTFLPAVVLDRQLEHFDLLRFFPVRVYSCDTIYRKPHRRIYQCALEKLNLSPDVAVMVGDKLREDVKGPARLGIKGVLKCTHNNTKHQQNNIPKINTIAELPNLITTWQSTTTT